MERTSIIFVLVKSVKLTALKTNNLIHLCVKQNRNTHPRCIERSRGRLLVYRRAACVLLWSYLLQTLERVLV